MDYFFEKGKFTEDQLEQAIVELFQLQGYTYVHGENIHRQYEDILLEDDLRTYLLSRYTDLSEVEVQKIINKSEALSILLKKNVSTISSMHYITYSTASSNNCKMPVFKIDNLKIKHQNIEKNLSCMLGISFSRISNGFNYQMLIGLDVVKNLK